MVASSVRIVQSSPVMDSLAVIVRVIVSPIVAYVVPPTVVPSESMSIVRVGSTVSWVTKTVDVVPPTVAVTVTVPSLTAPMLVFPLEPESS